MHFDPNEVYHIYNRGNNKQPIFFHRRNYSYFLSKVGKEWKPWCDILCYCLMPNHFHFMIATHEEACRTIIISGLESHLQEFSKAIGKTLSSYTKAINIQNGTTGSLFQKKTKAKLLTNVREKEIASTTRIDHITTCFQYIHENPLQAGIVNDLATWPHSSYLEYTKGIKGICNSERLFNLADLTTQDIT